MRRVALSLLLIANLFPNQVLAEDVSSQPLTRADCVRAGMTWNDTANVCTAAQGLEAFVETLFAERGMSEAGAIGQPLTRHDCYSNGMTWNDAANVCGVAAQAAEAESQNAQPQDAQAQDAKLMPMPEVAEAVGQPLTRRDCDSGGMIWNDSANVCGATSRAAEEMPEGQEPVNSTPSEATNPVEPTVLISIDKASQTMTVLLDGVQQYEWPVSTGLRGYTTPSGTYTARSMNKIWYSRQWDNAPMPHAVFFTRDGHAIHGTQEVKRLGKPASHGCVRLSPENAATLFTLVEKTGLKNTQVVLAGSTPGGEGKVAYAKPRKKQATRSKSRAYAERFGRRWWFRRYYATPEPFYMGRRGWR
jgi:lipoprotein-anchoring transpeptidase ErfK/SrfK